MSLASIILLIIAILGLIKTGWGLLQPQSFKSFGETWLKMILNVNTLTGIVCILLAICVLGIVLVEQPLVHWILVAISILWIWAGTVYLKPESLRKLFDNILLNRSNTSVRIMSALAAILCLLMLWVAIRGR